jgi:hypothetical protein
LRVVIASVTSSKIGAHFGGQIGQSLGGKWGGVAGSVLGGIIGGGIPLNPRVGSFINRLEVDPNRLARQGTNGKRFCIPRIGQEVIVEFLEGDPDRPLVTGSVYNPAQMPPYTLPANANMMGMKSNTTKGGGGYNEIVIVDGKAGELIRIHAQKDMDTTVQNKG